jgi:hypothetical protein
MRTILLQSAGTDKSLESTDQPQNMVRPSFPRPRNNVVRNRHGGRLLVCPGVGGSRRKGFSRALFTALVARGKTFPRLALSADAASRPTSHGPYFKANGRRGASLRAGIETRLVVFNVSEHFFKFFPV